jgi:hypothetical protein
MSLNLVGGRINNILVRKGVKRYNTPNLPDTA